MCIFSIANYVFTQPRQQSPLFVYLFIYIATLEKSNSY